MVYKINAVKSVDDPHERRQRLAQLFSIFFKNTESATPGQPADSAADIPNQVNLLRPGNRTTTRRRAGQTKVRNEQ